MVIFVTVKDLKPGQSAVIKCIDGTPPLVQRLQDMGLTCGTVIRSVSVAPMGDPVKLQLRGFELSLRKEDAGHIMVGKESLSSAEAAAVSCPGENVLPPFDWGAVSRPKPQMGAALIGNPNCGKTTVFNKLTGSNQYVGNWPGVTVEQKRGKIKIDHRIIELTDLPGIYSLFPYTMEEQVAVEFIKQKNISVVVNVVDSTNLERNLYLTLQLLEQGLPVIVGLNMMDEIEKQGMSVNAQLLSKKLGVPVIPISAKTAKGLPLLVAAIEKANNRPFVPERPPCWRDSPDSRYRYIRNLVTQCLVKERSTEKAASDKWDRILTHKIWGIPIFLGIMFFIFFATFGPPGATLQKGVDYLFNEGAAAGLTAFLTKLSAPAWVQNLVVQGIVGGVGGVLSFLPQIAILFFLLSFLEDSGYMSRIAFIMDRTLRRFGLSGKAFIPMLMGFGCSVPAVMAARTMENMKDRRLTILLIPFMSCSAKLPIYGLLAGAFFDRHQELVVFSLYFIGIIMGVFSGLVFKKTLFRGQDAPFLMELPPYRMPGFGDTMRHVWDKISHFLKKAATLILVMNIILWFLQSFDCTLTMTSAPERSILAALGGFLAPAFRPLGFGAWQLAVALLAGLAAKESVVACLAMFYGTGISGAFLSANAAYSFLVFVLLYVPCAAATATMNKELGGRRWALISIVWQLVCAYLVSFIVYQVGRLF